MKASPVPLSTTLEISSKPILKAKFPKIKGEHEQLMNVFVHQKPKKIFTFVCDRHGHERTREYINKYVRCSDLPKIPNIVTPAIILVTVSNVVTISTSLFIEGQK